MNHNFSPLFARRKLPSMARRFTIDQTFLDLNPIGTQRGGDGTKQESLQAITDSWNESLRRHGHRGL
jgi:hypothetical protein